MWVKKYTGKWNKYTNYLISYLVVKKLAASSTTNNVPANGARNAVQIPHAAPVARKSRCSLLPIWLEEEAILVPAVRDINVSSTYWNNVAVQNANKADIWIIGPSGPIPVIKVKDSKMN